MQANHISPFLIRPASGRGSAFPDVPQQFCPFRFYFPFKNAWSSGQRAAIRV